MVLLHSFSGGADVVKGWLADFPNTYFSFSRLSARFSDYEKRGLDGTFIDVALINDPLMTLV